MHSPQYTALLKTAHAMLEGYNTWTLDAIMEHRSSSCVQQVLPLSLRMPPQNNEQHTAYLRETLPLFSDFCIVPKNVIVDEAERKVAVWATSTAMTRIGPYANEYMLVFHMSEDCAKVDKIYEFVDSLFSARYMEKLRRAIADDTQNRSKV